MQRRGRITLGPGGVLYLVVAGLIFAAAVYTQANLLFAAFGLVIGGLVVSALWSAVTLRKLSVRRVLPACGVAGRAMTLSYEVTNGSRLPVFSLVVGECVTPRGPWWRRRARADALPAAQGWFMHIGPKQTATVEAPCWPRRRGPLNLEAVEAWTAFPFGVFRRAVRIERPGRVLVLPKLHRLDRRVLQTARQSEGYGTKLRDKAGGHGEFFGLRGYRMGDPPRLIDWKRTARQGGRLVSREMTQPHPPRVVILLDLSVPAATREQVISSGSVVNGTATSDFTGSDLEEDAIALCASMIGEGYLQGMCIGLAVLGPACGVFAPHHSRLHRTHMLDALAQLDLSRRDAVPRAAMVRPSVVVRPGGAGDADGRADYPGVRVVEAASLSEMVVSGAAMDLSEEPANARSALHLPSAKPPTTPAAAIGGAA